MRGTYKENCNFRNIFTVSHFAAARSVLIIAKICQDKKTNKPFPIYEGFKNIITP